MSLLDKLPLDQLISYQYPVEGVTQEGLQAVSNYIQQKFGCPLPDDWDPAWVVKKGRFSGTFPKRVSSWMFRDRGRRVEPSDISEIGNIASRHTDRQQAYVFDFNADLDWDAGQYGDKGSCFWGGRGGARLMLREHKALAMRFYKPNGDGFARAWLARLERGTRLTGEIGDPAKIRRECGVVFNGYGFNAGALPIARVLSGYLGLSCKRIDLRNRGKSNGDQLWINESGAGYLIGPTPDIDSVSKIDLNYRDRVNQCSVCENNFGADDDLYEVDGRYLCENCHDTRTRICFHCDQRHMRDNFGTIMTDASGTTEHWCLSCYQAEGIHQNVACAMGHLVTRDLVMTAVPDGLVCPYHLVHDGRYRQCSDCERYAFAHTTFTTDDGRSICRNCFRRGYALCPSGYAMRPEQPCQCEVCVQVREYVQPI